VKAVDGTSLSLQENNSICIIGESGCGKTTLLFSIMNFPLEHISYKGGEINYYLPKKEAPINLIELKEDAMREYRGTQIGLIPQLPKESLNPWLKIGFQTGEILLERLSMRQEKIKEKVINFLGRVALPDPSINVKKYVNQLSVGEAQRVCIAMALMADPRLLLADEPLSSLDVTIQAAVIDLLLELKKELSFSYLFATHDLRAARMLGELVAVMYGGEIVEIRPCKEFFEEPLHPYSQGLLNASPLFASKKGSFLEEIPGEIPKPFDWPQGCKFHPRCFRVKPICKKQKPTRTKVGESFVECHLYK
jgi:oligopeptide/dipeptide ABC transporter ATP-binding protein